MFGTELFPPLLGRQGLRLRIVWFPFTPRGPRQGRTKTKLTQRATETALSASGAQARMSWLPAAYLPATDRSLNQQSSRGASAQPAAETPGAGRESEALGGSWSPFWALPYSFFRSFFFFLIISSSPRFPVTHTNLFILSIRHTLINHPLGTQHYAS